MTQQNRSLISENADGLSEEDATVNSLFVANQRVWDVGKINSLFTPPIALQILKIVLTHDGEDQVCWKNEATGIYTVKNAYRMFHSLYANRQNGESSNAMVLRKVWKSIWNMKILSKVRFFAWKAAKGILPTKSNLLKKNVLTEEGCDFCNAETENIVHALCSCPSIKEVWSIYFPSRVPIREYDTFLDLVQRMQLNLGPDMLELFFLICWSCWYKRNMKKFEAKDVKVESIVGNALAMQKSYKELRTKSVSVIRQQCRWEAPPAGVFKLNIDGAFSSTGSMAGIGAIVRDSKGEVIMSATKKEVSVMTAVEVEALAILRGL